MARYKTLETFFEGTSIPTKYLFLKATIGSTIFFSSFKVSKTWVH